MRSVAVRSFSWKTDLGVERKIGNVYQIEFTYHHVVFKAELGRIILAVKANSVNDLRETTDE